MLSQFYCLDHDDGDPSVSRRMVINLGQRAESKTDFIDAIDCQDERFLMQVKYFVFMTRKTTRRRRRINMFGSGGWSL